MYCCGSPWPVGFELKKNQIVKLILCTTVSLYYREDLFNDLFGKTIYCYEG